GDGAGVTLLLAATGAVTVAPLLLFGAAVRRIPLSTVGLLQYLA
ncbi:MAG: EamA family transporter RarD, partial [Gemmatimonadetes bacterium]|nr:EamA family transporter RarD [Gemmatimonadota bacterium]NIR42220.1 EamA family transporter RarD [Actinomycetota bacterium]NIU80447.1 EamA family transporter RarD [Gammaproteobacteria bacterium]NIQ60232.1 EamA family transporter RarD [Gemmatimonadota bacterium]NIV91096.1 EamA family transporter RarD [Actinomycetota bacterium]